MVRFYLVFGFTGKTVIFWIGPFSRWRGIGQFTSERPFGLQDLVASCLSSSGYDLAPGNSSIQSQAAVANWARAPGAQPPPQRPGLWDVGVLSDPAQMWEEARAI